MEKTIGQTVREVRSNLGLSQKQFANRWGISEPHLSLIERDKVTPRLSTLRMLEETFDLNLEALKSSYYYNRDAITPGSIIKNARIKANLSQDEASNLCHITGASFSYIENDIVKQPSCAILEDICKQLDLDFKKLKKLYGYSSL